MVLKVQRIESPRNESHGLREALHASGVVGTWEWNPVTNMVRLDRGAARLLAGHESLAGQNLRRNVATAALHPADAEWLADEMKRLALFGGVYVAEYRVITPSGAIRWLLSRGYIYCNDHHQPSRGCGILIDITDNREPGRGYAMRADSLSQDPMERAIRHAIGACQALEGSNLPVLKGIAEALLMELGHEVARSIARPVRH